MVSTRTRLILGFWLGLLLIAAPHGDFRADDAVRTETTKGIGDDLIVRELMPGVWLHVAFRPSPDGRPIGTNGLLIATGKISVLIDTGWNVAQTRKLLDWARLELRQPVQHVIVTHAHEDRMGGLKAVVGRPIVIYGHAHTSRLARMYGQPTFHWTFDAVERLNLGGEIFDLLYPGPGHAPDNIVVYLPRRRLLFAGCLVRPTQATTLGSLDDANLKTWPMALSRVIERYRDARIIVPGHGIPAGVELLSHTMELLEKDPVVTNR